MRTRCWWRCGLGGVTVLGLAGVLAAQPAGPPQGPVRVVPVPVWRPPPPPVQQPQRPPPPVALFWMPAMMVALAVAVKKQRESQEEEEMMSHQADPSAQFEYKIIRSATGALKHPAKFKAILAEEAQAGWELFEKLDCSRARLRRLTSWRDRDAGLTQDPYRTRVGASEGMIALWIILGIVAGVAVFVGVLLAVKG